MYSRFLRLSLGSLFALTLGGCGGGNATTPTAPANPSPPTVLIPAPRVLQAVWVTGLRGSGEQVTLTLSENGYHISRPPSQASGAISVDGDRIEFSQSTLCAGTGVYRWSLNGNSLLFTNISEPCPGRGEALDGQTYAKRD